MGVGDALIFGAHGLDILAACRRREQGGDDADGAARVVDIDGLAARVMRVNLDRGMDAARRRPADQQRHVEAGAFHLARHEAHFVERRRDEAGEADHVDLLADRRLDDLGGRHHHAEIDDLVIVAGEHDADDVLADVVDVALHRRHEDLAGIRPHAAGPVLFGLHEGHQIGDRLFHDARRFDDLRQEHLARAEEIADDVHAGHQRPFDDIERTGGGEPRLFDIGLDEFGDPVDERMFEPLVDRLVAPGEILALRPRRCCP